MIVANSTKLKERFVDNSFIIGVREFFKKEFKHLISILFILENGLHEIQTVPQSFKRLFYNFGI